VFDPTRSVPTSKTAARSSGASARFLFAIKRGASDRRNKPLRCPAYVRAAKEFAMSLLTLAILVALALVVCSLVGGLTSMVAKGEAGHHTSEQWMIRRVAFQALAVILMLLAVMQS
jgi:phage tail tape-measure protein